MLALYRGRPTVALYTFLQYHGTSLLPVINPKRGLEIKSGGRNVISCHPFLCCFRVLPEVLGPFEHG